MLRDLGSSLEVDALEAALVERAIAELLKFGPLA